jgi:hypothetical protein
MTNLVVITEQTVTELNNKLDSILAKLEKRTPEKDWLSAKETMALLEIKATTLWSYRVAGKLTFTKINKKVFYLRKDILKLLEQNKTIGFSIKK